MGPLDGLNTTLAKDLRAFQGILACRLVRRDVELSLRHVSEPWPFLVHRFRRAPGSGAAAEATAYTLGINWYLNRLVRLQAHWEHTRFAAADPAVPLGDEDVLITRFQLPSEAPLEPIRNST